MKHIFLAVASALALCSVAVHLSRPDLRSDVPVLYWVTDPNPARVEQVELFHRWLINNGHGEEVTLRTAEELRAFRSRKLSPAMRKAILESSPDGEKVWDDGAGKAELPISFRVPALELRVDSANRNTEKKIIQGVSGVAGDIMDCPTPQFRAMGLLADVTEAAERLNYDMSYTYPALAPILTHEGRQYAFPCNVGTIGFWVNGATFAKYGLEKPPLIWDFATFERVGKEFVKAANPPGERQKVFFADAPQKGRGVRLSLVMLRSLGGSDFNETLTRCTLDSEGYIKVLSLLYKWTHVDGLFPTAADVASFATDTGYGGANLQLWNSGNYAMTIIGRYMLIQARKFDPVPVSVSRFPCDEFHNAIISTRAAGVYAGGKHKDLAVLFQAFLASRDYNDHIVKDADALPPNPAFTRSEAFLRPPDYPNEWGAHGDEVEMANTIALTQNFCPFLPQAVVGRVESETVDEALSGHVTPDDAARKAAKIINDEIQRTIAKQPDLRELHVKALADQAEIDRLKAAGETIPLRLISNVFYRRYYAEMGLAE
jgi:multiple sugar transport system substrate-binding protein